MKKFKCLLLSLILAVTGLGVIPTASAASAESTGTTYYISSSSGSDSNDGLTEDTPFKTFRNINNRLLKAGDKVLLKCGDEFNERLEILGQGTEDAYIEVGSYGEGERPVIRLNNGEDDIGVLVKDFYEGENGKAVVSPIQYIKINNLSIRNSRLGIFVRLIMTSNIGLKDKSLQSKHVIITECDFENIYSNVLPELNAAVQAEEDKYDAFSGAAADAINKVYKAKMEELHGMAKGNLPRVQNGNYIAEGGGGYEYVLPAAIMVGGVKEAVYDYNVATTASALEYFTVTDCVMNECIAGVMSYFYNYNTTSGDNGFRSTIRNVRVENLLVTGCSPSAIGFDSVNGGAELKGNSVEPSAEGWGVIRNVRVVRGSEDDSQGVPLGTTDVIIEKCTNLVFEECEFLGMTNHKNCDGCGFDFEGGNRNIELRNSVIAYNEGGAILIMDNGSGSHKNLFIRNNLIYSNMQDSYHQYNNRNNAIDKYYISQYNEGNENIIFEGNMIHMQRYTKKGVEIELIGPNTAEQGGYEFVDNSVTYYDDNGLNYQEFSTYYTFNCAEDGSVVLENIDLHTKRYNAMYIQVRGKEEISGSIQGLSDYGNSKEVSFTTSTGYVDLSALEGLEWNIPYSTVRLTIDGGKANTRGSVEFVSNASFEYELLSDTQILISITGGGAIVFDESLTRESFKLCNAIIRKNITEAERVGLTQAVITLDAPLTEKDKAYFKFSNAITVDSSAYDCHLKQVFGGYALDGDFNPEGYYAVKSLEVLERPDSSEFEQGGAPDLTGLSVQVTYEDGSTDTLTEKDFVACGYDSSVVGNQIVEVKYRNRLIFLNYTVKAGQTDEEQETTKRGCGGVAAGTAAFISVPVLCAGAFILKKKGKE